MSELRIVEIKGTITKFNSKPEEHSIFVITDYKIPQIRKDAFLLFYEYATLDTTFIKHVRVNRIGLLRLENTYLVGVIHRTSEIAKYIKVLSLKDKNKRSVVHVNKASSLFLKYSNELLFDIIGGNYMYGYIINGMFNIVST